MNWATCTCLLLLTSPASGHDWYLRLRDANGGLCCGDRDCAPVDFCVQGDGRQGLLLPEGCTAIDWSKVLQIGSPDGRAHACLAPIRDPERSGDEIQGYVQRCVILPGAV